MARQSKKAAAEEAAILEETRKEGAEARRQGLERAECPYSLGACLTGASVQPMMKLRQAWMEGYAAGPAP